MRGDGTRRRIVVVDMVVVDVVVVDMVVAGARE